MAKTPTSDAMSKKQNSIDEDDITYHYIGVRASPFANDCVVFGLPPKEASALRSRFPLSPSNLKVVNGIMLKGTPFSVINALAELDYRVLCSSGEAEVLWTLQREN